MLEFIITLKGVDQGDFPGRPARFVAGMCLADVRESKDLAVRLDSQFPGSDQLTSLEDLLDGKFPKVLADQFLAPGKGLFPTPRELSMGCSCPDWAVLCKHIAAVLYGVGVRLDEHPELFFTLRQIDLDTLLTQAMQKRTQIFAFAFAFEMG